jgi:PncC family amidohydrolase
MAYFSALCQHSVYIMKSGRDILFRLMKILKEKKLTVSLAESATCGMTAHLMNTVPGTIEVLLGSVVCYNESVKKRLLKVEPALIRKNTAESREVTDAIAEGLMRTIPADIMIGITGLASANNTKDHPELPGTMFITVIFKGRYYRYKKRFTGTPLEIKRKCSYYVFLNVLKVIKG